MYQALTTSGGLITDPNVNPAKLLRCVSCGASGNANLCAKCFALHLDALNIHTDGLFTVLLDLHKNGILGNLLSQKSPVQVAPSVAPGSAGLP